MNGSKGRWAGAAAALLLAGCASTPAPVSNYSFGSGATGPASSAPAAPVQHTSNGVQTFGLGGHANGTVNNGGYTVAPGDTLYSIAFANGMDVRALAALNNLSPPYVIHPGEVLKLRAGSAAVAASPASGVASGTTTAAGAAVKTAAPVASAAAPVAAPVAATPAQPSAPVFGPVTTQHLTATGVAPAAAASSGTATVAGVPAGAATATQPVLPAAAIASPQPVPPTVTMTPTPPPGASRNVAGITWQWPASGKIIGGFKAGSGGDGAGLDIAGQMGDPVRAAAAGTVVYSGNGLIGYGELIIIKHNDTYLSAYGHNSKRLVKEGDHVTAGQEIALMGASGAARVELHFEIRKDGKPVDPLAYLPQR